VADTDPTDRHLVGGERARLVGADNRRTAERLDRRQTAHDGVLLGHTTSSEGEARRDDGRQTFRDGGHRQRHGDLEVVDGTLSDTTTSHRATLANHKRIITNYAVYVCTATCLPLPL